MPFETEVTLTAVGDDRWSLGESLVYRGERDTWIIPRGYVTDLATVPRMVAWLIPTYGRYTRAAIVHDYLITNLLCRAGCPGPNHVAPNDIDGIFRRILRELGVSAPRRWAMWAGVRWGALLGGRERGWWRTAPAVLAVSVAAAPVVALGGIPVMAALLVWHGVEMAGWLLGDRNASARPNLRL